MKKKTRVYIDGNNLYYGLLKNTPWKWLDLPAFVAELVGPDHEIVAVNYFTAPIKSVRLRRCGTIMERLCLCSILMPG